VKMKSMNVWHVLASMEEPALMHSMTFPVSVRLDIMENAVSGMLVSLK
jgi:hypothetical protein